MPELGLFGWMVVGFLAGWLSGVVVDRGGPRGCCADMVIGVLGGILGGWFATAVLHRPPAEGFLSALIVAFLGATVLRLIFHGSDGGRGRPQRRDW